VGEKRIWRGGKREEEKGRERKREEVCEVVGGR